MIRKKNKKRKRKIANLLLRNYVFLYFLMTFILVVCLIIIMYVTSISIKNIDQARIVATHLMKDDYKTIDVSKIVEVNGFIEIIDKNLNVIYKRGNTPYNKKKYTRKDYHEMILSHQDAFEYEDDYIYSFAYNKNKEFLLVVGIPSKNLQSLYTKDSKFKPNIILKSILFFYLITLVLGILLYSRLTSKNFVTPLKIILNGVKRITDGDYSTRISLKSENEFGELSEAFNLMAAKIEEETNLKEKSEKNRRKLIMDISHDLKNPLASVIGYSDLLIKNPSIDEKERIKFLSVIENNSIRANNLIKDLFEYSKLESTDFSISLQKGDICEFLRELIAVYIPQMEEKDMHYDFDIPEEGIIIQFDYKNLDRAISNLILNSIKYNPLGTTLKIEVENMEDKINIILEDNGIGIPKELVKDIFEPFVRVDSSRNSKSGGTGLGLAITKTIIEKHGGTLRLDTDKGKGCKFTIILKKPMF
ncbi:HAMP domain-containing sensor histidine kinase [Clostridium sp. MB40-C1]|uniref:HAMP domain-containing sensor histidine kinase n=1 Tax=Clostridium sp. MB40-C1 TaxID=3070996 RepID=UPI0027DEECBD|nr:HAMP domain-containing sensor histidine kinase [Clostridium sp. MB40-C1]WMJ81049.1 HAMP domain-containing sensor histidine kinase [Clostridium sp. MB40-C1]